MKNGVGCHASNGLALCCHGPAGSDSPGHSLKHHLRRLDEWEDDPRNPHLGEITYPCRWCGCAERQVLSALGARARDKFPQEAEGACGSCRGPGYHVGRHPLLCLWHLLDRVGLDRALIAR